jgi:hypothetical protein
VYGSLVSGCLSRQGTVSGRTLRYGSSGNDVRQIQQQINTAARSLAPLPILSVDGQYGRGTERAVVQFQNLVGLTADGVVGTATRTRLRNVAAAVEAGCLPTNRMREGEPVLSLREEESPWQTDAPFLNADPVSWTPTEAPFVSESSPWPTESPFSRLSDSPWPSDCPWRDESEWSSR